MPSTKPGKRREAREAAIQFLYSYDLNAREEDFATFWELRPLRPDARQFAEDLIRGVLESHGEIDARILATLKNYKLERLSAVDRNILRLAVYEMLHRPDVPRPVAINEAIEIAKRFGTPDSAGFVNGILDGVRRDLAS